MSWESTLHYYRFINQETAKRLGGLHSAKILMHSVDFGPMARLQQEEKWDEIASQIIDIGKRLEKAGADLLLICTNTTHQVADDLEKAVTIPLLHIANAVAEVIKAANIPQAGLLGTVYTSKYPFYTKRLESAGIKVILPDEKGIAFTNRVIYEELCQGEIKPESRSGLLEIIDGLAAKGAQGIVLGCTELPMIVSKQDTDLPLFDTLKIHAQAAVDYAVS